MKERWLKLSLQTSLQKVLKNGAIAIRKRGRCPKGPFERHLLVEEHAGQEGERVAVQQLVGRVAVEVHRHAGRLERHRKVRTG